MMLDTLFPYGNILAFLFFCALFALGMAFGAVLAHDGKEDGKVNPWATAMAVVTGIALSYLIYHIVVGSTGA